MKKRGKMDAYFSVEASLVLPMVVGSIIFVVCFLLFWYNRCLMEQNLNGLAVKASQSDSGSMEELERELGKWQDEYLTDKHYAWESGEVVTSLRLNWYEFKQDGKLLLGDRTWKAQVTGKAMRIHPTPFLRLCRRS